VSALSDLVYGKDNKPWPHFTDKYPVKVKQITGLDNDQLEKDIRDAGDYLGGRTAAKCLMTRWDMHAFYQSFVLASEKAMEIDKRHACPNESSDISLRYALQDNPLHLLYLFPVGHYPILLSALP
jgi:hypothetical protein